MKRKGLQKIWALCLCMALFTPLLASFAQAQAVYVSFSDPQVMVNGSVTVTVHASVPVAGVNLNLVYDTEYLSYVGQFGGLGNAAVNAGTGTLNIVDYDSSSESDFTLNLSFTALKQGSTMIRVASCSISDAGGDTMAATWGSSAITITAGSSDATLQSLSINPGTLSPAFSPSVTEYTATVSNATTWIAVTAIKNDEAAYPYVEGHDSLNVGKNTVTVTVTAGDGSKKVYTIIVTRGAAGATDPTATPAASASPDATPEPSATPTPHTTYAKVADGTRMEIGTFTTAQVPAGFAAVELTFNDSPISAIRSEDGTRTAVYLLANAGNAAGFYLFDPETGIANPMNVITSREASYTVLDAAECQDEPPVGCVLQSCQIEGVSTRAWVPETEGAEYLVFYGSTEGSAAQYYLYDTARRSVQRYGLAGVATPVPSAEPGLGANEAAVLRDELAGAQDQALAMKRAAEITTVAALIMLVAVVVLAYLLIKKRIDARKGE